MKVLMVTRETASDRRYGLGKSLAPLVEGLSLAGVPTLYFDQTESQSVPLRGPFVLLPEILGFWGRKLKSPCLFALEERIRVGMAAAAHAKALQLTHVHLHDPWLALGFLVGAFGFSKDMILWGVTQHGYGSYANAARVDGIPQSRGLNRCLHTLERKLLERASWVITPTRQAFGQLLEDLGVAVPPSNWRVIPHPRPEFEVLSKARARQILGISDSDVVMLAIGRLVPLKHFDRIIEAFAALSEKSPALSLVILGGGDPSALQGLARRLGVDSRIRILCVDEVASYLFAADLYVSASETESFGLANFEALCAGLPCICSSVGGVPEVLRDGALLYDPESSRLEDLLLPLIQDAKRREDLGRKGLEVVKDYPSRHEIVRKYLDVYQSASLNRP